MSASNIPAGNRPDLLRSVPTMMHAADYRIRVRGGIHTRDVELLSGLEIASVDEHDGVTVTCLEGRLADQAALVGAINALYAHHHPVVSVQVLEARSADSAALPDTHEPSTQE